MLFSMTTPSRLDQLADLLRQAPDEVFLQPHNVPDPDAIASCLGLQYLLGKKGVPSVIVYDREIEKANSLKMLEVFNVPMMRASEAHTLGVEDWAVLVDGQKGNANLTDLATEEVAVIDHHEYMGNNGYRFEDVRPEVGSCSAIIAEYFFDNGIEPPPSIATALIYGIFMDTDNLTRGARTLDIDMFYRLYSLADFTLINELKGNEISIEDLALYADAFKTVEIYDEMGFVRLASVNDSLLGAASDIVLSVSTVNVVVAFSVRSTGIKLSTRSEVPEIAANELVRAIVEGIGFGGGHRHMSGGFIPLENLSGSRTVDTLIKHRAIRFIEDLTAGQVTR
jgi:nanoRNase/pAp phosphatase (c-di-AMP/oligoRNAs hydrolase)